MERNVNIAHGKYRRDVLQQCRQGCITESHSASRDPAVLVEQEISALQRDGISIPQNRNNKRDDSQKNKV